MGWACESGNKRCLPEEEAARGEEARLKDEGCRMKDEG